MPKRCPDVFAWRRTFMSTVGPSPIARLVLQGMSLFMAPSSGGCCWLSVRRLAEITGLDKGTVSKHRAQAASDGWLISESNLRHRQSPAFWCAVPDGVVIFQPRSAQQPVRAAQPGLGVAGHKRAPSCELPSAVLHPLPSGRTIQSQSKLYVLRAETVRSARTNRTSAPDQSWIKINNLQETRPDALVDPTSAALTELTKEMSARTRLDTWMQSGTFVKICQTSPELALRLTPPNCRVRGYESLVREAVEEAKKAICAVTMNTESR